jgi:hypothetical protein
MKILQQFHISGIPLWGIADMVPRGFKRSGAGQQDQKNGDKILDIVHSLSLSFGEWMWKGIETNP